MILPQLQDPFLIVGMIYTLEICYKITAKGPRRKKHFLSTHLRAIKKAFMNQVKFLATVYIQQNSIKI